MSSLCEEFAWIALLPSDCLCDVPLYQSGEATLGSDEYYQYDVYSIRVASRYGANPVPPAREDYHLKLLKILGSGRDNFDFSLEERGEAPGCLLQLGSGILRGSSSHCS